MRLFKKGSEGFTLIELIIVIAVLGILSVIAIPRLTGLQDKAKDADLAQVSGSIRTAFEAYYFDNQSYPATDDIENWTDLKSTLTILDITDMEDYNIKTGSLEYELDDPDNYTLKLTSDSTGDIYNLTKNDLTISK